MGGGILQLVAYSSQDFYLTGNPQITYFKVVYRRHTNFSMECIKQTINGKKVIGNNGVNNKGSVVVSRNGDLLCGGHVRCILADNTFTDNFGICGDNIIEDVEIEIGGQRIDKHYKEWNQIWNELTIPESKAAGFKYMSGSFSNSVIKTQTKQSVITYPLNFWFCRNKGLSLPIIALQFHDIHIKFTWGDGAFNYDNNYGIQNSVNLHRKEGWAETGGRKEDGSGPSALTYSNPSLEVWLDYIYLDTDERRRFSQVSHEYLIEQLQIQKEKDASKTIFPLNLEHPVKEIIWTTPTYKVINSSSSIDDNKIHIELNGHERFSPQYKEYFTLQQPYEHHTSIPNYNIKETEDPVLLAEPISLCSQLPVDGSNYIKVYNNQAVNISSLLVNTDNITLFKINILNLNINVKYTGDYYENISEEIKEGDIINVEVIKNYDKIVSNSVGDGTEDLLFRNTTSSHLYVTKVEVTSTVTTLTCKLKGVTGPHFSGKKGKIPGIVTNHRGTINLPPTINLANPNGSYLDEGPDPSTLDNLYAKTPNKTHGSIDNKLLEDNIEDIQLFIGEQLFVEVNEDGTLVKKDIGVFRNYEANEFNGTNGATANNENYLSESTNATTARNKGIYIPHETFSVTIIGRSQNHKSRCSQLKKDIYVYSFAINPEEHQPSGTCNFSKLDSAKLILSSASKISNIYAVNYNILRIMSGMGGLAYAN